MRKQGLKILELTNYSAGICGVWTRVRGEAIRLAGRGHEVRVFTSNFIKGSTDLAPKEEEIGCVKIMRFPSKKLGGESFMRWKFEKVALEYRPDVIIAHSYRHPHTTKALKIARQINAKVFLVTHAPFINEDSIRSVGSKIIVGIYDKFVGPQTLNKFNKIIAITKWETSELLRLGLKKEKVVCIPNGIPEDFFKQQKESEGKKILFLGRISPIKSLETLIRALKIIKDKKVILEIVGPAEENYLKKLQAQIKLSGLSQRVIFSKPIFNTRDKIKKIDSAKIFVLPSIRESMPQSLIEAMARGKVVIASNNPGAKEIIIDGKNGYLFPVRDEKELANKINMALSLENSSMKKEAKDTVKQFSWNKIIKELENLINSTI